MRKIVYALLLTVFANVAKAQVTSANGTFIAAGTTNLGLLTNTTPRLTIIGSGTNIGRVWIGTGTPAPADLLHVNGTMRGSQLNLTGGILNTIGATNLSFRTNNTQWMTLLSDGKVGIGTPAPAYKLDVAGTINATSILINGQPLPTSQWTTSGSDITYSAGNVGIGTTSANSKLQVLSATPIGSALNSEVLITRFSTNAANQQSLDLKLSKYTTTDNAWWGNGLRLQRNIDDAVNSCYIDFGASEANTGAGSHELGFGVGNSEYMRISYGGKVSIGTTAPGSYKLAVAGKIAAWDEIKVFINGTTFPDYVFDADYKLRSLEDTESYIKENHHLPEVPSAAEVAKEGMSLNGMSEILLKKVEELTLHLIEMKKESEMMKKEIEELKRNQKDK